MAVSVVHSHDTEEQDRRFVNTYILLQELDTDLYMTGTNWKSALARSTFGGQTVAQALYAASQTVKPGLHLHSMHCYFLRGGDSTRTTIYRVSRTRDGRSFSSRTVIAIQKGLPILTLQASFHNEDAEPMSILSYQPVMPAGPHHSELRTVSECVDELLEAKGYSAEKKQLMRKNYVTELPFEMKPLDPEVYMRQKSSNEHALHSWVRISGHIGEDVNMHRCAAAFVSDWSLLGAALTGLGRSRPTMTTSLDHSLWFHRQFKMTDWLLYETVSPQFGNSRALCEGRLWTEDGQLVVSVMQQGLARGKL